MKYIFSRTTYIILFLSAIIVFIFSSCRKDPVIDSNPSYKLDFSVDTVIFDTVFTTLGSTTRYLKVYNRNNGRVNISNIYLASGLGSEYQINVDGSSGIYFKDIELDKGDSLFILIKVTVDPTDNNSPFIVSDSIIFETNNNLQDVNLAAWGQNAHYFVGNKRIDGLSYPYTIIASEGETVNWEDDKPYIIYGWGVVDSAGILNIGPGCNIHFHQNSGLWIYRGGNINVNGLADSVVTFQGDRLEKEYSDLPGQWDRIWINEGSIDNTFNFAEIKNGFIGIQAETTNENTGNSLILENTIIRNMSRWGMFTINYNVISSNSVFANCAENTLFLSVGGKYDFRHCTFANYWNYSIRQDPSFVISNHLIVFDSDGNKIVYLGNLEKAYFGNCIIYGNLGEEIILANNEEVDFNFQFDHCFLKTELNIVDPDNYISCQKNVDPIFADPHKNNYRLDSLSPAANIGSIEIINSSLLDVTKDLDGNSRIDDDGPDLGSYEFLPE